jgi:hypothetical protein
MMLKNYLELNDEVYKEFVEYYSDKLPNPEQYPIRFKFLIESFLHYRRNKSND